MIWLLIVAAGAVAVWWFFFRTPRWQRSSTVSTGGPGPEQPASPAQQVKDSIMRGFGMQRYPAGVIG